MPPPSKRSELFLPLSGAWMSAGRFWSSREAQEKEGKREIIYINLLSGEGWQKGDHQRHLQISERRTISREIGKREISMPRTDQREEDDQYREPIPRPPTDQREEDDLYATYRSASINIPLVTFWLQGGRRWVGRRHGDCCLAPTCVLFSAKQS